MDLSIDTSSRERLLPSVIDHRASIDPQGVWAQYPASETTYEDGFQDATNSQVANAVNVVAWDLKEKLGTFQGCPTVTYLGPNDLRYYIVLLAAAKVGCKTFFPSPRNSNVAHLALLSRLDSKIMITPSPAPVCVPPILEVREMQHIFVPSLPELLSADQASSYPYEKTFEEAKNEPIFVLHTSGSTGIPKPLIYTNDFVARFAKVLALDPPAGYSALLAKTQRGRFFSLLPPFHIAGVGFSLISPCFCEAAPVYPLPGKPPSTGGFIEAVENGGFDWAFLLPVILDELSRDSSSLELICSKLQHLYYTGGSLPKAAGDVLEQKIPVYTCMGSSEAAGLPLIHPEDSPDTDAWKYIQPHAAAGIQFRHRYADAYELVIVRGHDPEHIQPVFAHFPELTEYETRDLFIRHPTRADAFRHQGRIDDIIVFINGEKTNPITFEQHVGRHPEVRSALVGGSQRFEACLLVELLDTPTAEREDDQTILDRIWPSVSEANKYCPNHAKVSKARMMLTDPAKPMLRAGKGTVQRQGTLDLYTKEIDLLYVAGDADLVPGGGKKDIDLSDVLQVAEAVRLCVTAVTEWDGFDNSDDFFALSMDSLQVLQLSRELKRSLGLTEAGPSLIYQSPSVALLANAISRTRENETPGQLERRNPEDIESVLSAYKERIDKMHAGPVVKRSGSRRLLGKLRNHSIGSLRSILRPAIGKPQKGTEVVVLTGSTGAVGSYLLHELLERTSVSHVYCLNRSENSKAVQEARNAERGVPCFFPAGRVTFLTASLADQAFGVDQTIYDKMLATSTQIIHNAWPVNFNQSLQSFRPSLDQLLALVSFSASAKLKPSLFFLSSISAVTNYHLTSDALDVVPEAAIQSMSCPPSIGYGQSKFVGECILQYAALKLGIKTGAARVGQIAGTAQDPRGWNRNEWFPSLVVTSRALRALPLSLGAFEDTTHQGGLMDSVDWLPIDQLAPVLIDLSGGLAKTKPGSQLQMYHPLNPNPREWKSLAPTVACALDASLASTGEEADAEGSSVRLVPYAEWLELLRTKLILLEGDQREKALSDYPAIKLFDFFDGTMIVRGNGQAARPLAIDQALEASASLRSLEAIRNEWLDGWVRGWVS